MLEKKISLEEIFDNNFNCYTNFEDRGNYNDEPAISKDKFKELCIDFGKQVLELAAKNAENNVKGKYIDWINWFSKDELSFSSDDGETVIVKINKQSIINTINQIE